MSGNTSRCPYPDKHELYEISESESVGRFSVRKGDGRRDSASPRGGKNSRNPHPGNDHHPVSADDRDRTRFQGNPSGYYGR